MSTEDGKPTNPEQEKPADPAGDRRAAAPPVGVELFLLGEFYAAAVHQPNQGNVEPLGKVLGPQDVLVLPRNPGAGQGFPNRTVGSIIAP